MSTIYDVEDQFLIIGDLINKLDIALKSAGGIISESNIKFTNETIGANSIYKDFDDYYLFLVDNVNLIKSNYSKATYRLSQMTDVRNNKESIMGFSMNSLEEDEDES